MDGHSFDRMAQALAGSKSRRRVIATAAAGFVASAFGRNLASAQDDCGQGFEFCDGDCHFIETSNEHCGGCGNACGDLVCIEGTCATCESAGQTTCYDPIGESNYCADLDTSWNDCGECGNRCTTGPCENGVCISTADCDEGFTECMGQCVDLNSDVAHCGGCSNSCMGVPPPGQSSVGMCVDGGCEIVCLEGFTACEGDPVDFCADLAGDPEHCGSCGNVCAEGTCTDGICGSGEESTESTDPDAETPFADEADAMQFVWSLEATSVELARQGLAAFAAEDFVGFPSDTRTRIGKIRDHDKEHLAIVENLIGDGVESAVAAFAFADVADFINRAWELKQITTAGYALVIPGIASPELLSALAGIATIEGRHAAWLAMRTGEVAFEDATEVVLTREEIEQRLAALAN